MINNYTNNMTKDKIECHELALAVPEMTDAEYQELKQSISENGQREAGIMLDGKILDGRHRQRACEELDIPFAYRQFDKKIDGLIPEMLVMDANIKRRHLTPAQKAAIAAELSEKIAEAKKDLASVPAGTVISKGERTDKIAADKVGASTRSVSRARKLKQDDPEAFEAVKKGEVQLNTAVESSQREQLTNAIAERHEGEFVDAIEKGVLLKTTKELKEFCELPEEDQKAIWKMIAKGWTVQKALRYIKDVIDNDSTVKDVILRAMDTADGVHYSCIVGGWEISASKVDA